MGWFFSRGSGLALRVSFVVVFVRADGKSKGLLVSCISPLLMLYSAVWFLWMYWARLSFDALASRLLSRRGVAS